MDMMAMAFLFDMASRNRRVDERFDMRAPACRETLAEHMFSALFRKRRRTDIPEDCDGTRGVMPHGAVHPSGRTRTL